MQSQRWPLPPDPKITTGPRPDQLRGVYREGGAGLQAREWAKRAMKPVENGENRVERPERAPGLRLGGALVYPGLVSAADQRLIVEDLRAIARVVPPVAPMTPYGKPMSVQMTSAGRLGWLADRSGYRYATAHPNGAEWPPIPARVLAIWQEVAGVAKPPDCCLINFYGEGAKMGMHQDRDEADLTWPVVSLSLGDEALFRIGGKVRGGATESLWLRSGDVVVLAGDARLAYHGIDRLRFGSSTLLPKGGRINLTLRVAG